MKLLLPCPACKRSSIPPSRASAEARLRCPVCSHELTAQALLVETTDPTISWEVVEDHGDGNVFSEVAPRELADFNGAAVPLVATNGADLELVEEDMFGVSEDHWQSPADGASHEDIFHPALSEYAEPEDGLAAVALAASGEPDTMNEIAIDGADDASPLQVDGSSLQIEVLEEEGFEPLAEGLDEQVVFDDDTFSPLEVVDDNEIETEETLALIEESENLSAMVSEASDPLRKNVEEGDEVTFEDNFAVEEKPDSETLTLAPIAPKRSIAPEILLDSPTSKRKKKGSAIGMLLSVVGGGFAAIPISILLMWHAMKIDPLDLGPVVASVAPWIVPANFQGSQSTPIGKLPEVNGLPDEPPMVTNEPMVSPPSDDIVVEPPKSEELVVSLPSDTNMEAGLPPISSQSPDDILDTSIFSNKTSEPLIAVDPSTTVVMKPDESGTDAFPKLDPRTPEPTEMKSEPEALKSVNDAFSALSVPTVQESLREALTKMELAAADLGSETNLNEFIDSLQKFSSIFATIPVTDPRFAIWLSQSQRALESIDINNFRRFSKADSQKDPASNPGTGWIGSDLVMVKSTEKLANGDVVVTSEKRRRSSLDPFPIVVPASSAFQAQGNEAFWFVGIVEDSTTLGKAVYRVLMSIKK
jgi:hypothetical protein